MSTVLRLSPPLSTTALFEQQYQAQRSRKQRLSLMYGALFLLALGLSAWVGEFNPLKVLEGLPRVGEYVLKTLPSLGWATLGHDIAEWFWGLPKWLKLLWETVLIAYLGTLLGTVGALLLCFDGSENMKRHPAVYWLSRRTLEVSRTVPELVFALVFVYWGVQFVRFGWKQESELAELPMPFIFLAWPVAGLTWVLFLGEAFVRDIRLLASKDPL